MAEYTKYTMRVTDFPRLSSPPLFISTVCDQYVNMSINALELSQTVQISTLRV
jgi:hypothetical protein